uniref:Uncharacterized protein n=1 Tax=Amphimedon queenslandica TaxID=400682 RepID=A0A1X7VXC7_AMPQE
MCRYGIRQWVGKKCQHLPPAILRRKPLKRKASPPLVSNKKGKAGKNWKGLVCHPFSYSGQSERKL